MRRSRSKLALAGLALLGGLFALEGYARVFHAAELSGELQRERLLRGWNAPLMRYDVELELGFALRRELDLEFGGVRVTTDADGFRIDPDEPAPGAGALRVAVVGASSPFGVRIPVAETYPRLLRAALERRWERPVALRVFAVPGYVSMQQARVLELAVLPWQPDLVVWHYDHRDALPLLRKDDPELQSEPGENPLRSAALKLLLRRLRAREAQPVRAAAGDERVDGYLASGAHYDAHLAALERAASRCAERGIPALLVVFDAFVEEGRRGEPHFEGLHAPLVPRLERAGFHVLDLFPRYQSAMRTRGWSDLRAWWQSVAPQDGHPNAEGHAFLAAEIAAALDRAPFDGLFVATGPGF